MRNSHPPTGLKREAEEDTPAERTYKEPKLEDDQGQLAQERMRDPGPPTGLKRDAEENPPAKRTYKERKLKDGRIVIDLTND
jgi:hypothetical protein